MSIWGNPVMMGGSGGGNGNAYAYTVPPAASVGENGEYYFELVTVNTKDGVSFNPKESASVASGGWEFVANSDITIVGARAKTRSTYDGTVKLANSSGTVLSEKAIALSPNWNKVFFDTPIQLTAGNNYIIMLFGNSGTLLFTRSATADSDITYVRGRYNGLPGTQETGVLYSVDILIGRATTPPYPVKTQYYKTGGVWVAV